MSNHSWNKVLIVDDEPTIRLALAEALRGWDYETSEADTGAATLAAIGAERPAAVLLDINLPDSSGLDLLREIKRRSPQAAVCRPGASGTAARKSSREQGTCGGSCAGGTEQDSGSQPGGSGAEISRDAVQPR